VSQARLASSVLVNALIRMVNHAGGFAMVLAKGDDTSGQLLIQCLEKGRFSGLYERLLDGSGAYKWQQVGPQTYENTEEIAAYVARRRGNDPDLWLLELDIPDAPRFIAEAVPAG
jgi:hypothetical protein